jgi:hypothetical protein
VGGLSELGELCELGLMERSGEGGLVRGCGGAVSVGKNGRVGMYWKGWRLHLCKQ